jgi:hypothetical protein
MGGDDENGPKRRQTRRLGPRCVFFEYKCFYHIYFHFISMKRRPVPTPTLLACKCEPGVGFSSPNHPPPLACKHEPGVALLTTTTTTPPSHHVTTSSPRRPPHHHVTHHHAAHVTMSPTTTGPRRPPLLPRMTRDPKGWSQLQSFQHCLLFPGNLILLIGWDAIDVYVIVE